MIINITPPKKIPYLQILLRTKKFYQLNNFYEIVEDKEKRYYIFLKKRIIHINLVKYNEDVIREVQNYLNYTFRNSYIGIESSFFDVLNLKGVQKIKIG